MIELSSQESIKCQTWYSATSPSIWKNMKITLLTRVSSLRSFLMRSAETLNNSAPPISTFFSYTRFSHPFTNKNIVPWSTETYVASSDEHLDRFVGQETVFEIRFYRLASKWTGNSAVKALYIFISVVLMILWPPRNGILEMFGSQAYVYKKNCGWVWGDKEDPDPTTLKRKSPLTFWFSSSADTLNNSTGVMWRQRGKRVESQMDKIKFITLFNNAI